MSRERPTRRRSTPTRPWPGPAGTHTRRLRNMAFPTGPATPVEEVRIEHGGVYVLSHLPRQRGETYVGPHLHELHRAAEQLRTLLPERYRSRVTAALVIPTDRPHADRLDVAATVDGVLVLDAASLEHALRCASPALSTSEVRAVERLLRRDLRPVVGPTTVTRRGWRLPRPRVRRPDLVDAA